MKFLDQLLEHCREVKNHNGQNICSQYSISFAKWIEDFNNEESLEGRVKHLKGFGLDSTDGFFIWSYTGSSSSWVNSDKRNGEPYNSSCKKLFAEGLNNALMKLPVYVGKAFRMEGYEVEHLKWFKQNIGTIISIPYFLSTDKEDYDNTVMIWIIETHSVGASRDISLISNNTHEKEILFNRNSKFKITDVNDSNSKKLIVYMSELPVNSEHSVELAGVYYK